MSVVLLILLFKMVDEKSLFTAVRKSDKAILVSAFALYFMAYVFCLLRWQMLLKACGIHLSLKRTIISFSGGIYFNTFLPSTVGGDFIRSIDLSTHTQKPRQVIATVLLDRLSGFVALIVLALSALLIGWKLIEEKTVLLSVGIITTILLIILGILFNNFLFSKVNKFFTYFGAGKIANALKNLHGEIHAFKRHKTVIIKNLLISLLVQVISPLTFYMIALSLGVEIDLIYFFVFLPIIGAVALLPISIGGLGLRDAATVFFFAKVGVAKDLSFAMSLLNSSFILMYAAIGGLIYVFTLRHRRLQPHK